jgi:hypothetical protein
MFLNESGEKYIDLNKLPNNIEIPLSSIIETRSINLKKDNFSFEETVVNDTSASIRYNQFGCKMLIEVFGPREVKFREKMKNDSAIVETYIKMNYDANKESNYNIN